MSSIDILQNPTLNNEPDKENSQPNVSLMSRYLRNIPSGAAWLPDLAINSAERLGNVLAGRANPYNVDNAPLGKDPINSLINKTGILDIPAAQSFPEQFAEGAGQFTGGMALGGGLNGASQAASSLPALTKFALTKAGQIAAPAAVGPMMDKYDNNNPYVTVPTQILASILGGGAGGGISKLVTPNQTLPEYTAAQSIPTNSPAYDNLMNKQENLLNTDKKSAAIGKTMLQNQQQKLGQMLGENPTTTGDQIASKIEQSFDDKIAERAENYQDGSDALFADKSKPINVDNTISALGQAQQDAPKLGEGRSTSLENAINNTFDLIANNSNDPIRLKGALSDIQQMANPAGPMQLSSQQSAILRPVINSLRNDIDTAYPGFKDLNTQWANNTQELQDLRQGVVGKIDKKADISPEQIFQNIFEKTSPARIGQVQDVLGPDLYGQAANTYLKMIGNKQLTPNTDSINNNNPSPQIKALGDYFRNRQDQLSQTLPPDQNQLMEDIIDRTTRASRGIPSGNFGQNAQNTPNNPISAITEYNKNVIPYVADIVKNTGLKQILNSIQRNQMLTGQSPTSKIMSDFGGPGLAVSAMDQSPPQSQTPVQNQPQQPSVPYQPQPQQLLPIPDSWKQKLQAQAPQSSGFSDFDKKYGLTSNKALGPTDQPTSFADFDAKYGLNGAQPPQQNNNGSINTTNPSSQGSSAAPLPQDVLDFIGKRLKAGDTNVLYDPQGEYQKYNASMAPDSPAFLDKVKNIIASRESGGNGDYSAISPNSSALGKYQFIDDTRNAIMPGVSRQEFLNNPDIQEQAMNNLMLNNENTFKNNGIDPNSVKPDDLAGMLMAAHLRGPQAGIAAYQNANYQGDPDANGTLPRDYYDYAKNSFNNGQFDSGPDFKSMNTDQLLNYGKNLLQNTPLPPDDSMQT